jgi:hypothetical protein
MNALRRPRQASACPNEMVYTFVALCNGGSPEASGKSRFFRTNLNLFYEYGRASGSGFSAEKS